MLAECAVVNVVNVDDDDDVVVVVVEALPLLWVLLLPSLRARTRTRRVAGFEGTGDPV